MKMMLILIGALFAQETQDEKQIANKISQVKISVDFRETALPSVIDYIREITDINILVDSRVEDVGDLLISIKVQNLTVQSVLRLILTPRGLGTIYRDGVLFVTSIENINKRVILDIYDIRDLLHPLKDFPGVDIQLGGGIGSTFTDDDDTEGATFDIEEMIRTHTGGKTWEENEHASVSLTNGILMVKNTKAVHKQVRRLLNILRRNK